MLCGLEPRAYSPLHPYSWVPRITWEFRCFSIFSQLKIFRLYYYYYFRVVEKGGSRLEEAETEQRLEQPSIRACWAPCGPACAASAGGDPAHTFCAPPLPQYARVSLSPAGGQRQGRGWNEVEGQAARSSRDSRAGLRAGFAYQQRVPAGQGAQKQEVQSMACL